MRVIIHGGMFKTGTTSLQKILKNNCVYLERKGIRYPETASGQHSYILDVRSPSWDPGQLREIAVNAEKDRMNILFLSGEVVSSFSANDFRRLTGCFSSWRVEYIFCFRHWSTYLPSRWSQNCIRRDSQTLETYLSFVMNPGIEHFDVRYDLILDRASGSGDVKVKAVSWDQAVAVYQTAATGVLRAAMVDPEIIEYLAREPVMLNQRLSITDVELCRILNGITAEHLGLIQDEIFWTYACQMYCRKFFDYISILDQLPGDFRERMKKEILAREFRETGMPSFIDLEKRLKETHGEKFDVSGKSIFGVQGQTGKSVMASVSGWQEFSTMVDESILIRS
jgi:hypothetical protein